ncbi:DUF6056 family protein [Flavobacterium sp.]|uniref:DUF6056 family protein n=1 Tax=Flavobacterium sp. TaxID=239 RepID=UPI002629E711|nr:DUF6056 family protein [Flavobacterium sp.]
MMDKWTAIALKWMGKLPNVKTYHLFTILGLFCLFPLLFLSFFNHPASDDFGYSYETITFGFKQVQIDRYYDWSGRYFSNAILSVDPIIYNNFTIYKLIPIGLFLLFVYSLYYFLGSLFGGISTRIKWAFAGLIFFLYFYQMADVCEGLFWLPGSITYQLANVLFVFLVSFILKYYKTKNIVYVILSSILIMAIVGCNEIITLTILFLFFTFLLFQYQTNKKLDRVLIVLFAVLIVFTGFSILAPGNAARETFIEVKHQFFYSVVMTLIYSAYYLIMWSPILLISALFVTEYFDTLIEKIKFKKVLIHPLLSFVGMFLVICCGIFPGFWSLNTRPPGRAINTIYFFFVFAFLYFLITLFHYFKRTKNYSFVMPNYIKIVLMFLLLMNAFSSGNIRVAYSDLLSGRAYKFDKEMKNRYDIINNSESQNCVVPAIENAPLTIFSYEDMELTTDKENWKNDAIAKYFKKESIVIDPNSIKEKK